MNNKKTTLIGHYNIEGIASCILDAIDGGINIVDTEGILVYANNQSAKYVNSKPEDLVGYHISDFYPQAALINVLKTKKVVNYQNVIHENGQIYRVKAYPLFEKGELIGGFSVFTDITEVTLLNKKVEELELNASVSDNEDIFSSIVGWDMSLKNAINKAKKSIGALGGPRHSIITGESGTGKTMLARTIYYYAKSINVISRDAPFVEVNCAQYTNPDIAAMEIFGSVEGAYTGSKNKKGLFELANGGILFLDEAHTLDEYQNLLLKAIESGTIQRIGGTKDIDANVIIITASTKDLKKVFIPELYQRLAQYQLYLPPLRARTDVERQLLLNAFIKKYEKAAKERYSINLEIEFDQESRSKLMEYNYPRNIRQFRDIVNASIDSAVPLISTNINEDILGKVSLDDLPSEVLRKEENISSKKSIKEDVLDCIKDQKLAESLINELAESGLGPRRIANILNEQGIDMKYYQVAYRLKKRYKN